MEIMIITEIVHLPACFSERRFSTWAQKRVKSCVKGKGRPTERAINLFQKDAHDQTIMPSTGGQVPPRNFEWAKFFQSHS